MDPEWGRITLWHWCLTSMAIALKFGILTPLNFILFIIEVYLFFKELLAIQYWIEKNYLREMHLLTLITRCQPFWFGLSMFTWVILQEALWNWIPNMCSNVTFKIVTTSSRGQWVNKFVSCHISSWGMAPVQLSGPSSREEPTATVSSPEPAENPWSKPAASAGSTVQFSKIISDEKQQSDTLQKLINKPLALIQVGVHLTSAHR